MSSADKEAERRWWEKCNYFPTLPTQLPRAQQAGHELTLNTLEKYALLGALCDKLKWGHDHGYTRADHLGIALRLVDIVRSLPEDGDAA